MATELLPANLDLDDDQCPDASFFEEADEVVDMINRVTSSNGKDAHLIHDRLKTILYRYQEQSQLLDGHLEGIVLPLATLLRTLALAQDEDTLKPIQATCRLLNVLVVVRGYKTVARFFPHEAADLERVLNLLLEVKARNTTTGEEGLASWESQAILLLWLSILILMPFGLATLDSAAVTSGWDKPYTALVGRILQVCQEYLQHPGAVREMSGVVLGRLLTRPDMAPALDEFLAWAPTAVASVDSLHAPFLLPGVLRALCCIFKFGTRGKLLPSAAKAWAVLGQIRKSPYMSANMLARMLGVKLVQRIGLTFLPPRLARWRYQRGAAAMDETLASDQGPGASAAGYTTGSTAGNASRDGQQQGAGSGGVKVDEAMGEGEDGEEAEDEDFQLVEEVEEVVEELLAALRDKDTVVRWSAAKGVGRLAGCLPQELAEEVVEQACTLFKPTESDMAWHGGCLALAELARRGLLLPSRLPTIAPVLQRALHYDVRRGPHSIGAHVRDAGAYVCWAFARAYSPELMQGSISVLASSLLTAACYDREVNCRRAAAAAFQESVGRLGTLPHGIEIITIADYFSVGVMAQAYLNVAPRVAAYHPYALPLAQHLVEVKLRHWEKALRVLAARALGALLLGPASRLQQQQAASGEGGEEAALQDSMAFDGGPGGNGADGEEPSNANLNMPSSSSSSTTTAAAAGDRNADTAAADAQSGDAAAGNPASAPWIDHGGASILHAYLSGPALALLLPACLDPVLEVRHGAVLGVGELVLALSMAGLELTEEVRAQVAGVVPAIDKARLYRGKGGEVMREAVGRLVECCARAQLPLSREQHAKFQEALDENLRHPHAYIQMRAVCALRAYARTYLAPSGETQETFISKYLAQYLTRLHDPNVAVRRGYSLALGALPRELLGPRADQVVDALVDGCRPEEDPEQRDVDSRANCVRALGRATTTLYIRTASNASRTSSTINTNITGTPSPSAAASSAPSNVIVFRVLPCLERALADYTTDNRGDVGSLVREAAMEVMVGCLRLLPGCWDEATCRQQLPGLATRAASLLLRQAVERIARTREVAAKQLGLLLEHRPTGQAVAARLALQRALPKDTFELTGIASLAGVRRIAAVLAMPQYRPQLLEGLIASIGGVDASLAKLTSACLLQAASAHCTDANGKLAAKPLSLEDAAAWIKSTAAATAAAAAVDSAVSTSGSERSVVSLPPAGMPLLPLLAGDLLAIWRANAKSPRLATPLLRAADLLVTKSAVAHTLVSVPATASATATVSPSNPAPSCGTDSDPVATATVIINTGTSTTATGTSSAGASSSMTTFAAAAVELTRGEVRGCGDVGRLVEAAGLQARLALAAGPAAGSGRVSALQGLLVLLGSKFPKVRRCAAEQLYLGLLGLDPDSEQAAMTAAKAAGHTDGPTAADLGSVCEPVCELLLATAWDGDIDAAKKARDEIALLIEVQVPKMKVPSSAAPKAVARDEFNSYQALLDDFARGY